MGKLGIMTLLLWCALGVQSAYSGDYASDCIRLGSNGKNSQTLTNTCSAKVEVAWCHHLDKRGVRDGLCNNDGKFYQKHVVLEPGEVKENQYSLPLRTKISWAACFGGYYTFKQEPGWDGRFTCKDRSKHHK